ncbi:hypothetical protein DFS34DRAFT_649915 [Phlyctochytrium arcticum]|nr:hypothetical protein DFS34DRAFT_649915 [Phlyctochytrium arcticum]
MATVYTISLGMLHNRQIIRQTVPEWEGPVDARIWQDEKDEEPTSVDDELLENHELTAASMGQGVMEGATPQEVSSTSALSPLRGSDRRGASAPITEQESFTPRRSARRASALAIASLTGGSTPIPTAAITASSISPVSPSVPPTNDASADASNVSNLHPPPLVTQLTSPACDVLLLAPKDNPAQSVYIIRTNEQQVVRLSKNCQDTLRRKLNRKRGNGEGDWGSVSIGTCPACTCSIEKGALIYERQVAVMRDKFQGLSFRLVPRIMCPVCFDRLFIQLREQAPPEQMPENEQHIIRLLADDEPEAAQTLRRRRTVPRSANAVTAARASTAFFDTTSILNIPTTPIHIIIVVIYQLAFSCSFLVL